MILHQACRRAQSSSRRARNILQRPSHILLILRRSSGPAKSLESSAASLKTTTPEATASTITKTTTSPPQSLWRSPTAVLDAYSNIQRRRPYATQIVSSLSVYLAGDLLAQYIGGNEYDPVRTLRHLIIGAGAAVPVFKW